MTKQKSTAWYKQKWPWLLISLPLLSVIAGVITYQIAANKPHSMVQDDYFKQGLAINQSIAKQQKAKELGLVASLQTNQQSQLIIVNFSAERTEKIKLNAQLIKLHFSHPTQQKHDKLVTLEQVSDNEYLAELPNLPQANWHIILSNPEQAWQMKSRWLFPAQTQLIIDSNNNN